MAVSDTVTKLPLDTWFRIMGAHPLHVNGIVGTEQDNVHCAKPWFQYEWQDTDRVSREQVARAIRMAEDSIELHLKHRLLPSWELDEWQQTVGVGDPLIFNRNRMDIKGYGSNIQLQWGHFILPGRKAMTLLVNGANVQTEDRDKDEFKETCKVVIPNWDTDIDPCEVRVFYPGMTEYEVKPIRTRLVVQNNDTTTLEIEFKRYQIVKYEHFEQIIREEESLEADENENFYSVVDVYRVYTDPSYHATGYFERTSDSTGLFVQARGNPKFSVVSFATGTYDELSGTWSRIDPYCMPGMPESVKVSYYAGYRDTQKACPVRDMASYWEQAVAYFACTFLDRPVCDCGPFGQQIEKWRFDLSFSGGSDELSVYNIDARTLDNPLGTQAGAVYAWKRILEWREKNTMVVAHA